MRKILMLAGDFTEDYEVMVPYQALEMVGFKVDVVCPDKNSGEYIKTAIHDFEGYQTYTEKIGHNFQLNASFNYLKLEDYDGLYITGGRAPEYLRLNNKVIDIVKFFIDLNKPVAAICHGIQILTAANVIKGRKLTAYSAVKSEVILAGGLFQDIKPDESIVDGNLVTSPAWPGNTAILKDFLNLLKVNIQL
ncbi:DJ-1/PfpI family protein [Clostridium saccharobutylicum]|uniref:Intracellular protease, PfpI family n=1 Tax=Clostridium saccharobutylicum DSM 13864 TaxID=1345695 RepID=U5N058_CLOSA|nr:DJ-1/PfpI family protein [Clostridium saccharobutylicum]AGX45316.1 intracellular protease, PfpI family [Clostridium saccharobutylicum DSM 13864]AQR92590.1 putative cysteine protease YraA [Clostridium saccharobutylicum]AQS02492.1 putative cysteine protease YraA [Clostridium saccharobutylicum]AQS12095.1 putative cysteine protease YraA [Clostridium saccharobutylicum]AQS16475.1 putative cysteine protease YraA [Clostridium saccharobutylicum]